MPAYFSNYKYNKYLKYGSNFFVLLWRFLRTRVYFHKYEED